MKKYLENVLTEIPQFITHLSRCLFHPSQLISQHVHAEENSDDISKGTEFLILSFLIALFVGYAFPEAIKPTTLPQSDHAFVVLGSEALLGLFQLFLVAVICWGSWRIVGIAHSFWSFFRIFTFFCGVSLVLLVFADAITNIAMIDPVVAKSWLVLEETSKLLKPFLGEMFCLTDPVSGELLATTSPEQAQMLQQMENAQVLLKNSAARPLALIGNGLQWLVYLVMFVWLTKAWFSYGKFVEAGRGKTIVSALLASVLAYVALFLVTLIQVGAQMMEIYRNCPQA